MSVEMDNLKAAVARNTTVVEGAMTFISGLKTQLDAAIAANASGDASQLQALSDALSAEDDKLAAAIATAPDGQSPAANPVGTADGQPPAPPAAQPDPATTTNVQGQPAADPNAASAGQPAS